MDDKEIAAKLKELKKPSLDLVTRFTKLLEILKGLQEKITATELEHYITIQSLRPAIETNKNLCEEFQKLVKTIATKLVNVRAELTEIRNILEAKDKTEFIALARAEGKQQKSEISPKQTKEIDALGNVSISIDTRLTKLEKLLETLKKDLKKPNSKDIEKNMFILKLTLKSDILLCKEYSNYAGAVIAYLPNVLRECSTLRENVNLQIVSDEADGPIILDGIDVEVKTDEFALAKQKMARAKAKQVASVDSNQLWQLDSSMRTVRSEAQKTVQTVDDVNNYSLGLEKLIEEIEKAAADALSQSVSENTENKPDDSDSPHSSDKYKEAEKSNSEGGNASETEVAPSQSSDKTDKSRVDGTADSEGGNASETEDLTADSDSQDTDASESEGTNSDSGVAGAAANKQDESGSKTDKASGNRSKSKPQQRSTKNQQSSGSKTDKASGNRSKSKPQQRSTTNQPNQSPSKPKQTSKPPKGIPPELADLAAKAQDIFKEPKPEPPPTPQFPPPRKPPANCVRQVDNWILYTYFVEPGSMNVELGCVLRTAKDETALTLDAVTIERMNDTEDALKHNEELVSNIIKLSQTDPSKYIQLKDPITLTIPHCAPRNMRTRETVIKRLEPDGKWIELPTKPPELCDEDFKKYDFVETLLINVNTTLAVVTRIKQQSKWIPRKGAKLTSVVDRNVSLEFKPKTFDEPTKVTIQVETVEKSDVTIAKHTNPECDKRIVSSTPFVTYKTATPNLAKPVTVTVPIPPKLDEVNGISGGTEKVKPRPASACTTSQPRSYPAPGTRDDTDLHLLTKSKRQWSDRRDIHLTKNNGLATFKVSDRAPEKFVVLRTGSGTTQSQAVEAVTVLENSVGKREIRIIMGQNSNIPQEFMIHLVPIDNTDKIKQEMEESGYQNHNISNPIAVREGQQLNLGFTGNITQAGADQTLMNFHSHATGGFKFYAKEVDLYAQRARDNFSGHAQIYANEQEEVPDSDRNNKLCQFGMHIPKPPRPKTAVRKPPPVIEHETLSKQILQILSMEISADGGSDFVDYVEKTDKTGKVRRAIRVYGRRGDNPHNLFNIMHEWFATLAQSENKVAKLCQVLHYIDREDLVKMLNKL